MTAPAVRTGSLTLRAIVRPAGALLAAAITVVPTGAEAQVGAVASVYSEDRYRGLSFSDGRPVAILDISYDAADGLYGALSGSVVATRDEGIQMLGYGVNGGYATRLKPGLTLDVGVVHSHYSHYSGLAAGRSYTEAYAGVSGRRLGARLSISPNYLGAARWTAHGEVDGHLDLSRWTVIEGDIGALTAIGSNYRRSGRPQFDARLGVAQRAGPVTLHAAVTTRSKAYFYSGPAHGRTAFVAGLSFPL